MGKPKIFVLDTNVILHDHKAIRKFQDNHLVIPVAVIEEVDKFNRLKRVPVKLTMSKGSAAYNASKDTDYRKVFLRAEENEKRDKAAYYAANPKTES